MKKKIILDNREMFVAIQEYFSKRNIELPKNVMVTVNLKKKSLGDIFSDEYTPYIEVEYEEY